MDGEPGFDYPEERAAVDVMVASRHDALVSFVQEVHEGELILSVGQDSAQRRVRLDPGERLELVWKDVAELRTVPAELVAVDTGGEPTWRVRTVGPATRGQRRAAVRAPLISRVSVVVEEQTLEGRSVDMSEAGVRCLLDAPRTTVKGSTVVAQAEDDAEQGAARASQAVVQVGAVLPVTVWLDDRHHISATGEVVRRHIRHDRRQELSIRFLGLPERMQDLIRREVFACLRDLRARGLL